MRERVSKLPTGIIAGVEVAAVVVLQPSVFGVVVVSSAGLWKMYAAPTSNLFLSLIRRSGAPTARRVASEFSARE